MFAFYKKTYSMFNDDIVIKKMNIMIVYDTNKTEIIILRGK